MAVVEEMTVRVAVPFCKYAGGKTSLLGELLPRVPDEIATYYEPFVGGGALFWALAAEGRFRRAVLNDTNVRLVRAYLAIQQEVDSVVRKLRRMKNDKAFFLRTRARDIDREDNATVAAWFIYLNRTCFNGLYRTNKSGQFNVPFGAYNNPRICDEENLRACSEALQGVALSSDDFENAARRAKRGDFMYADPPYYPRSGEEFVGYGAAGFGHQDHVRLRDLALRLKQRGARVLLSNSGAQEVRELYSIRVYGPKDDGVGFEMAEVKGDRRIGARSNWRVSAPDLLIW